ncbi:MAG: 4Fe-4S dicluster domain-containing protein [Armatimonadota bacterium]|nr:MAG: 4Fe-4S dicluster domain-containing protein [Armatimonadota bacterium]
MGDMASIVQTVPEKCKRCYTCVRSCPAKAIKVEGGQARVIEERCLTCGNCIRVCAQHAKSVGSGRPELEQILAGSRPAIACLAPSFPAAFEAVSPGQVIAGLRQLGFAQVMEVAYGAELTALAYRELLSGKIPTPVITTPCPALVSYVEKYLPELIPNLAPIVSPMIALARFIRTKYCPEAAVVFIGPCTAKKAEIRDEAMAGIVDVVLTYEETQQLFAQDGVALHELAPSEFDGPRARFGGIFPVSGGLLKTAHMESDILENDIIVSEGVDRALDVLRQTMDGALNARFLDLLFCNGCIAGPVMGNDLSIVARKELVVRHVRQERAAASEAATYYNALMEAREGLDLSRSFHDRSMPLSMPSDAELATILAQMGKHEPEDELNCGACGYPTCRDKAVAVYQGLAEAQMCLPFLIDELETTIQELADSKVQIEKAQSLLIQSERLASMGQLAAAVAHELNNPLGTVLIYAHTLLRELQTGDPRRDDVQMIAAESERCRKIVRGLLDFARKRSRQADAVDIGAVLENVIGIVQKHAVFSRVNIDLRVAHDLPTVDGDADQLTQAFVNLATNAAEAMPDGGKLTISACPHDGDRVDIAFTDEGVGISEENRQRLFTPFFTTKAGGKGTGLGLPIVYGVVKMHSGDVRVDSEVGKGTTFTITLNRWREGIEETPVAPEPGIIGQ